MIVFFSIQSIAISPERSYDEGMNDLKTLLNHLPYKLAAYDTQGNFLYDNGGADGSFFPREPENLPDWIMSEVLASPTKKEVIRFQLTVLIKSSSRPTKLLSTTKERS